MMIWTSGFQTCPGVTPALHIFYASLIRHTQNKVLQSLLMSWWFESGVLDDGDMLKNVQGRGASRTGLKTTDLDYLNVKIWRRNLQE